MVKKSNGKVFLTDGVIRRTLAAARGMGREGVHVTCGESTRANLTFWSRYCHSKYKYPSHRDDTQKFVSGLLSYLKENPHDCLFPMEQDTLDIILNHREEFEKVTALPFVDKERYQVFRDKAETMKLCEKIGIAHPKTLFTHENINLAEAVKDFRFPLIIKPRGNWSSRGVLVVRTQRELEQGYEEIHAEFPFPIIQEKIPQGEQFHVCCLMDENSELRAVCTQTEPRHYPYLDGMGTSTVQVSVDRPDLVEMTVKLLKANNWYGVANSDIIIDPRDGTALLIEVNPRFWGPMQASINSGVNFPFLLHQMVRGEYFDPVLEHKVGVITRSFLPYDILHFLSNPDRFKLKPNFFNFFGKNVRYDILSFTDPLPLIGFFATIGRYLFDPEIWQRLAHMEKASAFIAKITGQKKSSGQQKFDEYQ